MLNDLAAAISTELGNIRTAAAQGDHAALPAAAHRLKNGAGIIGATRLAEAAGHLESQADGGNATAQLHDDTVIRALFEHWSATRTAIQIELAQAE